MIIYKKPMQLNQKYHFTSKANTLLFLQNRLKNSKIEKILKFTVAEWNNDYTKILHLINEFFGTDKIIVRSSAIGEDSYEKSEAGNYATVQNVNSLSNVEIKKAILQVINSYTIKKNKNPSNQIFIQKQITNIKTSGVIFTRDPNIGAPYYIINFEEGATTDGVTKGQAGNTIKIFRKTNFNSIPKKWRNLLRSITEIETILSSDYLDIEFGINQHHEVIIFQVRPLTSIQKSINNFDENISKLISQNKEQFLNLNRSKHVLGDKTIFSDMSDWNPAEIIGNNPHPLDYSLYNYLIMEKSWHQGRTSIGYENVNPYPLMTRFGNKPYVDVRGSFNSLIPNNIKKRIKQKLIKFYLNKLANNPHLHDKVEFEILFTCYEIGIDSRLKELELYNFTKSDLIELKKSLMGFTNKIINQFPKLSKQSQNFMLKMKKNRLKIKSIAQNTQNHTIILSLVHNLLKDCKTYGAIHFSTMARIAFVGSILLKSLRKRGYLKPEFVDNFMNSLVTPLSDIQNDLDRYINNQISKKEFLEKYGHLRPGTYDITAFRYDMQKKFFDNIKFLKQTRKSQQFVDNNKTAKILKKHGLNFDNIKFFDFVKQSLTQREELKFEFTKNLSDVLELIVKAGNILGFTRNELAYLDIETILNNKSKNKKCLQAIWAKKISSNKKKWKINNFLILPPLIFSIQDFEIIKFYLSKPNFITRKSITSDLVILNNLDKTAHDIENKIVIIENADPGYDWIFTKNPSGLVTKYGGVASHMAIRCAEIDLPAAIGCGEILFEKLKWSSKILLDCKNEQIIILEYEKEDEYVEEKKILKSLGYIK